MTVLALDLASLTGWAVYAKGMDRPFHGSKQLKRPTGTLGEAYNKLLELIAEKDAIHGPITDIVYEAQHIAESINPQTMYLLIGLGAVCELAAHQMKARCFAVDIGTWRKHFLGKGGFRQAKDEKGDKFGKTARQQAKEKSIDTCNALGWFPVDDNAADACGVLDYYLALPPIAKMYPRPWRDNFGLLGAPQDLLTGPPKLLLS